jgi:hypothetical protein
MNFIIAIALAIVAGKLILRLIELTIDWVRDSIRQKLKDKQAHRVVMAEAAKLLQEAALYAENTVSLEDLDKLADQQDYFMATIDENNEIIGKVEGIKCKNVTADEKVARFFKREPIVIFEQ